MARFGEAVVGMMVWSNNVETAILGAQLGFDFLWVEMEHSPELEAVQKEYMRLAAALWLGSEPLRAVPMKDRDIFDLLGFD